MAARMLASLRKLAREKQTLYQTERRVVADERRLFEQLRRAVSLLGYRLTDGRSRRQAVGPRTAPRRRRLKCPRCNRRFSHPLPMARHVSAMHRSKKKPD